MSGKNNSADYKQIGH